MKKLRLDALEVTSFETAAVSPQRGTVQANIEPRERSAFPCAESFLEPCYPTDPNFDCTYGCSQNTGCPDGCIEP